tara:strand:- start:1038 stop:1262 length:225 start_codon:yes stop_codon:yes gene_type:complete
VVKTKKEQPRIKIDDKEYNIESMSNEQKAMLNHISDLDNKLKSIEFNLVQLRFGRQAFVDALKVSIDSENNKEE